MKIVKFALLATLIALTGCAGLDDAMTPGLKVVNNDFDNSVIVDQPLVVANRASLSTNDSWHQLGFEWSTSTPDVVYITAGVVDRILNIYSVAFIADDQNIAGIELASNNTVYDAGTGAAPLKKSTRRFALPLTEFRKIAAARIVKMKISRDNDFTLSRFGQDYPDVTVSRKIVAFLAKVDGYKAIKK